MKKKKLSFRRIMLISYTVILALTLGIYTFRSFSVSEHTVSRIAYENIQKLIEEKNELLDLSFSGIKDASLRLLIDEQLYKLFNEMKWEDTAALWETNKEINTILQKYFFSYPQISSVFLVTDVLIFGYGPAEVFGDGTLVEEEWRQKAETLDGKTFFAPAGHGYFAMIREANLMLSEDSGRLWRLKDDRHIPMLVVGFKEEVYGDEIRSLLPEGEVEYLTVSEEGVIISHSDPSRIGSVYDPAEEAHDRPAGQYVICQDTSEVTGWTTYVKVPVSLLMKDLLAGIFRDLLLVLLLAAVVGGTVSVLIAHRMNVPMRQMIQVAEQIGRGNFDSRMQASGISEFDYLTESLNDMGEKLKRLVEENYLIKIRQQESEIAVLNTQLNPHFLQNTLNVIQMSNLYGTKEDTGKMIVALSRMLHYTMDNREEMKLLREEIDWLQQYIFIMKCRYGNEFQIICKVDEVLMENFVPKLFLQPIVENSILHAFQEKDTDGVISITGKLEQDRMVFVVEDNGDGMSEEQVRQFFNDKSHSIGIKNVYARLRLIYGREDLFQIESRLGEGTRTTIFIPL